MISIRMYAEDEEWRDDCQSAKQAVLIGLIDISSSSNFEQFQVALQ